MSIKNIFVESDWLVFVAEECISGMNNDDDVFLKIYIEASAIKVLDTKSLFRRNVPAQLQHALVLYHPLSICDEAHAGGYRAGSKDI